MHSDLALLLRAKPTESLKRLHGGKIMWNNNSKTTS